MLLKNETGRNLDVLFEGPYEVKEDFGFKFRISKNKIKKYTPQILGAPIS